MNYVCQKMPHSYSILAITLEPLMMTESKAWISPTHMSGKNGKTSAGTTQLKPSELFPQ
jgi:hypothetical protein